MPRWNRISSTLGYAYIAVLGLASAACSLGDFDSLGTGPEFNVGGAGTGGAGGTAGSGGTAGNTSISGAGGTGGNGGTDGIGGSAGVGGTAGEPVNLISNPGFEEETVAWKNMGTCRNEVVQDNPRTDMSCLRTYGRTLYWNGPSFPFLGKGRSGESFAVSVWVRTDASQMPDGGSSIPIKLTVKRLCTSIDTATMGLFTEIDLGDLTTDWTELSGVFTYPDCPDLTELTVYVEEPMEPGTLADIYLDDTRITRVE